MTDRLLELPVKIFADGADFQGIAELARQPYIDGVTTNPTLMRKVGLTDYESFARAVLNEVKVKPISFEVFSDDFSEMRRQALKMHQWQENIYIKIPITNTSGESSIPLIAQLAREGVKLNITAVLTPRQVKAVAAALDPTVPAIQAAACHCHIVTVPHDILKKFGELAGKDLDELSLDTVRMFHRDAAAAGFTL